MTELQPSDEPFITDDARKEAKAFFLGFYLGAGATAKARNKLKAALANATPGSQLAAIAETSVRMAVEEITTELFAERAAHPERFAIGTDPNHAPLNKYAN
jgi:hypothetical protein